MIYLRIILRWIPELDWFYPQPVVSKWLHYWKKSICKYFPSLFNESWCFLLVRADHSLRSLMYFTETEIIWKGRYHPIIVLLQDTFKPLIALSFFISRQRARRIVCSRIVSSWWMLSTSPSYFTMSNKIVSSTWSTNCYLILSFLSSAFSFFRFTSFISILIGFGPDQNLRGCLKVSL